MRTEAFVTEKGICPGGARRLGHMTRGMQGWGLYNVMGFKFLYS